MKKTVKKRKKKLTGKTFLLCLFLIFAVYMGINLIINSGGSITTYMAREGEISESFTVDGYIFKDQTVINATASGYLECTVEESGRVGKEGTVAYIYEKEIPAEEKNRIKEIDAKIKELKENDRSMSASENDSVRLEQDILKAVVTLPALVRDNNMAEIFKVRKNLDSVANARGKISGAGKSAKEQIEELTREKATLESKNDMSKVAVKTPVAGSFTARVDGLEETLDDSKIEEITQGYLRDIKVKENKKEENVFVKKDAPIGKIVDTYTWYMAAIIDKDIAENLKVGDGIRLKFLDSSDNIINGSVYKIADEHDGKVVLVVKSAGYVDNLYSISTAKIDVIMKTHEGMKIPSKSIRVKDGEKGVYILSGNKIKFRGAKVHYMDDEWAIVSTEEKNSIKLYDSVIVSGSKIYEGRVVR